MSRRVQHLFIIADTLLLIMRLLASRPSRPLPSKAGLNCLLYQLLPASCLLLIATLKKVSSVDALLRTKRHQIKSGKLTKRNAKVLRTAV